MQPKQHLHIVQTDRKPEVPKIWDELDHRDEQRIRVDSSPEEGDVYK